MTYQICKIILIMMSFFISLVLLSFVIEPYFDNGVLLADSYRYYKYVDEFKFNIVDLYSLLNLNYGLPLFIAALSGVFDEYRFFVVALINFIIFCFVINHVKRNLPGDKKDYNYFLILVLSYPATLIFVLSLGKEVAYVYLLVVMLTYYYKKKMLQLALILPLMLLTRNSLVVIFFIFLLSEWLGKRYFYGLFIFSIIFPLFDSVLGIGILDNESRIMLSSYLGQGSSVIMVKVGELQTIPMLSFFLAPIPFLISLASGVYSIVNVDTIYQFIISLSSCFFVILLIFKSRVFFKKQNFYFLYVVIYATSLAPISQIRYYLPLAIVLIYMDSFMRGDGVKVNNV
ncbi:TPA: hypothetical protein ACRZZH_002293 [Vibrio harveyi]